MEKLKALWARIPLFWKDLTERVARTFVASFGMIYLGGILGDEAEVTTLADWVDWSLADKAATAGLLAAGSLILGLLTKNVGDKATASTFEKVSTPLSAATPPPYNPPHEYEPYTGGPREFDH